MTITSHGRVALLVLQDPKGADLDAVNWRAPGRIDPHDESLLLPQWRQ